MCMHEYWSMIANNNCYFCPIVYISRGMVSSASNDECAHTLYSRKASQTLKSIYGEEIYPFVYEFESAVLS